MMSTLREDLMEMVSEFRQMNEENAEAQVKISTDGLVAALRYRIRADTADGFAMRIHAVLQKHGL